MILVDQGAQVRRMILNDITVENYTGKPMPLLYNKGDIGYLSTCDLDAGEDEVIVNEGPIQKQVSR